MKIPVIINNRDLLTWPKAMVERIKKYTNVGEIFIIDNASTNPELLEWYKTKPCTIIYSSINLGHTAPWQITWPSAFKKLLEGLYVVTDSDLDLSETPDGSLLTLEHMFKLHPTIDKVGFGLDWEKVKPESPYYNHMMNYEKPRWERSMISYDLLALDVAIDTTFAMYKVPYYFIGGASMLKPWTARHLPWELTKEDYQNNKEFKYYIEHASNSSSYKTFLGL